MNLNKIKEGYLGVFGGRQERGNEVIGTHLAVLLALYACSFGSALGDCSGFFLAVYGS